jgi:hypothetical protein
MCKMMATGLAALLVTAASAAEVVNVEFKFTPFVGDPAQEETVTAVAGTAHVFLNGVPYAEQEVREDELPVLFEEREIAPAVWLPTESCGPALRKGQNTLRIEFEPADVKAPYHAQLRWASVLSESTEQSHEGQYAATNQSGEGVEEKEATGPVVFERQFQADFAADLPWHHYAAVMSLDDADKQALVGLVAERIVAFQPDFAKLYALLEGREDIDVAAMKAAKCLDQAYQAGARVASPPAGEIEFVTTGNPEVVVRAKQGDLFFPADVSAFARIEDEDVQMCLGMAFTVIYPPRLVVVRAPSGAWEVAY